MDNKKEYVDAFKQRLKKFKELEGVVTCNLLELSELRGLSTSIGAVDYSAIQVAHTPEDCRGKFTEIVEKIMLLEEKIQEDTNALLLEKMALREVIETIPDVEGRMVLQNKYFLRLTWTEISKKMNLSLATIYRIHKKTLDSLKVEMV